MRHPTLHARIPGSYSTLRTAAAEPHLTGSPENTGPRTLDPRDPSSAVAARAPFRPCPDRVPHWARTGRGVRPYPDLYSPIAAGDWPRRRRTLTLRAICQCPWVAPGPPP